MDLATKTDLYVKTVAAAVILPSVVDIILVCASQLFSCISCSPAAPLSPRLSTDQDPLDGQVRLSGTVGPAHRNPPFLGGLLHTGRTRGRNTERVVGRRRHQRCITTVIIIIITMDQNSGAVRTIFFSPGPL